MFKQKPVSFDKHSETMQGRFVLSSSKKHALTSTLAEIVKFREMLEQRIERRDPPLTACPDEHRPLIAKLANERYAFQASKPVVYLTSCHNQ